MTRSACLRRIGLSSILLALATLSPLDACAQIRTDSSLGRAAQTLTGPHYLIPQTLGRLAGSNLFYSFQTFNINTGESANFTTVTPNISNVVCRVTGGTASLINGVLSLTAASGTPNFFFINPSGVTFGAGASIDVPGAFHVSTADYIKFPDGNFYADATKASTFSSAAPEAFGFLGANRAAITVTDGASLSVQPGQPISIVAGDVEISNEGSVYSQGGEIRVVALGQQAQEIPFTGALPVANGVLNILNGGYVFVESPNRSTANAGTIAVSAGDITIDGQGNANGTGLFSQTTPGDAGNAAPIDVSASGTLSVLNGGLLYSSTLSFGNAGAISVTAGNILIDGQGDSTFITGIANDAGQGSTGNAGRVTVAATGNLSIVNGSQIRSNTFSSGDAGSITIRAGSIVIDGPGASIANGIAAGIITDYVAGITSNAVRGSTGNAGDVMVTATENLSVLGGSAISSSTLSSGNAGSVVVRARSILLDGKGGACFTVVNFCFHADTGILSFAGSSYPAARNTGNAGTVSVTATDSLSVLNTSQIASITFSSGNAGSVAATAGSIHIEGIGGRYTPPLVVQSGVTGIISAATVNGGGVGNVNVTTPGSLLISAGGRISASNSGSGNGSSISVNSDTLAIDGLNSGIYASAPTGAGFTGNVSVSASDAITLSNGAAISIENNGGCFGCRAPPPSTLTVSAPNISLTNARITASSDEILPAGNIVINFRNRLTLTASSIDSVTQYTKPGSISIQGGEVIVLNNAQISTSVQYGGVGANGGNISVRANALVMNTGFIQANTFAQNSAGGNVNVDVQSLVPSGDSLFVEGPAYLNLYNDFSGILDNTGLLSISSRGVFGLNLIQAVGPVSGTLSISPPSLNISGALVGLATQMRDTAGLGRNPCRIEGGSSLVQAGRGGFVPSARDLLGPPPMESRKAGGDQASTVPFDPRLRLTEMKCRQG